MPVNQQKFYKLVVVVIKFVIFLVNVINNLVFQLQVLLVLERRVHVYVHASRGCSLWDTCAPEAVLKAAGGMLTDVFGNGISYLPTNETSVKTGVLATMDNHQWYAQQIREKITL
jgi:3'-phosphoadenosine 5'-phosphosulfate (PAPS) 3'-phosphatase